MKRICFLIGNLNNAGGTEKVTAMIANKLAENHFEVFILNLNEGKSPFFKIAPNINISALFSQQVSFKANYFSAVFKIRNFIKENRIDSLIVVDSISCLFTIPALYGLGVDHICWEHFNFKNNNGTKLRDLARKFAVRYCQVVVTLTNRDRKMWLTHLNKVNAQISVIPNPIEDQLERNIANYDSKTLLSVGRLVKVKGFDLLLNAWKIVIEKHHDWKLCIVGGGDQDLNLKNLACELNIINNVIFTGSSNNVAEYYKKSSFYCLSSRFEGFPMVLLEAQSYGLPIVAFDCDTGPAEIVTDKINGYLAIPEDVQDLAKKLICTIELENKVFLEMSNQSYENSRKFNISSIERKWLQILNRKI